MPGTVIMIEKEQYMHDLCSCMVKIEVASKPTVYLKLPKGEGVGEKRHLKFHEEENIG